MIKMKTKIQKHFKLRQLYCKERQKLSTKPRGWNYLNTSTNLYIQNQRRNCCTENVRANASIKECHHLLLLCMPNFINCLVENFHTGLTICERWQVKWKSKYCESVWRNFFTVKKNEQCHYKLIFLFKVLRYFATGMITFHLVWANANRQKGLYADSHYPEGKQYCCLIITILVSNKWAFQIPDQSQLLHWFLLLAQDHSCCYWMIHISCYLNFFWDLPCYPH